MKLHERYKEDLGHGQMKDALASVWHVTLFYQIKET